MFLKIFKYFWSLRTQFVKYFAVGFSGVILDIGTLYLFTQKMGFNPTFSVALNQIILLSYNFLLNKYWSFKNKEMPHKQIVRFLTLAGANYLFSVGVMYIFNEKIGINEFLVRICTIALMVSWNFLLYKYWVYRVEISQNLS